MRKSRRNNIFSTQHCWEFGLRIAEQDDSGHVELVACLFCLAFGRETDEIDQRVRKKTKNIKYFKSFRSDNFRKHMTLQHRKKWNEYQRIRSNDKDMKDFFGPKFHDLNSIHLNIDTSQLMNDEVYANDQDQASGQDKESLLQTSTITLENRDNLLRKSSVNQHNSSSQWNTRTNSTQVSNVPDLQHTNASIPSESDNTFTSTRISSTSTLPEMDQHGNTYTLNHPTTYEILSTRDEILPTGSNHSMTQQYLDFSEKRLQLELRRDEREENRYQLEIKREQRVMKREAMELEILKSQVKKQRMDTIQSEIEMRKQVAMTRKQLKDQGISQDEINHLFPLHTFSQESFNIN